MRYPPAKKYRINTQDGEKVLFGAEMIKYLLMYFDRTLLYFANQKIEITPWEMMKCIRRYRTTCIQQATTLGFPFKDWEEYQEFKAYQEQKKKG